MQRAHNGKRDQPRNGVAGRCYRRWEKLLRGRMSSYRIHLVGDRAIRGRHDFDAERDQNATQITYGLLDACPDACQSFDLWQGTWRVAVPRLVVPTTFDKLSAANQERVFNTEETIVFNE